MYILKACPKNLNVRANKNKKVSWTVLNYFCCKCNNMAIVPSSIRMQNLTANPFQQALKQCKEVQPLNCQHSTIDLKCNWLACVSDALQIQENNKCLHDTGLWGEGSKMMCLAQSTVKLPIKKNSVIFLLQHNKTKIGTKYFK